LRIKAVLLDTSFFIRLLTDTDCYHKNAKEYYKYFLDNKIAIKCSTVSVAEYCVKGDYADLPLLQIQILPFNFHHAVKAGEMGNILFTARDKIQTPDRKIIQNDIKLFAQADVEPEIDAFVTSDRNSEKMLNQIRVAMSISFKIINIETPLNVFLGELPLTISGK